MLKMSQLQDDQPLQDIRPEQLIGALSFQNVVKSLIGNAHTSMLVQVLSVDSSNLSCSIKPLTMQIDAQNNAYERGVINNVPFFRLQGGINGIICDPQVGDIGLAVFCERDISMVKRNKVQSPPSSKRQYDLNDAVYIGGFLNNTPQQYIQFTDIGINIKTIGDVNINGMVIRKDGTIVTKDGVILDTHIHSQGSDSHGDTEQDTGGPHG